MRKICVFIGIICYLAIVKSIASPTGSISLHLDVFKISLDDKTNAEINWKTPEDIVSQHFIVEKSLNANIFFPIDQVDAIEAERIFNSIDKKVAYGASYYRLKHVSTTGHVSYSLTIQVNKEFPKVMELSPEANASNFINLNLEDPGVRSIEILNYVTGERIKEFVLEGQRQVQLNVQGLENGQYWLRIKYARKRQSISFVKE